MRDYSMENRCLRLGLDRDTVYNCSDSADFEDGTAFYRMEVEEYKVWRRNFTDDYDWAA